MIIKKKDDIQPEIDELIELKRDATSTRQSDAIQQTIDNLLAGRRGEEGVARHLAIAFEDDPAVLIIHDVRLEVGTVSAQIDHIVLLPSGEVCCLETKNIGPPVTLGIDGSWSVQTSDGLRRIDSPEIQAQEHAAVLGRWLKGQGHEGVDVTAAVVINSRLELRGDVAAATTEIVRAETLPNWLRGARSRKAWPDGAIANPMKLANNLVEAHRPVRVAWHDVFGLRRSAKRQAVPTGADMIQARKHLSGMAANSRAAAAERFLLGEFGGGGRDFAGMLAGIAGINAAPAFPAINIASVLGRVTATLIPSGKYTFHPQGDARLKAYIRRCANDRCLWSSRHANWIMEHEAAVSTLATMLADVREERSR